MTTPLRASALASALALVACGEPERPRVPETREARETAEDETASGAPEATTERREAEPEVSRFPLHGVATHFVARVFAEPRERATEIYYLRRGATFRAGERVPGSGCERGWHPLAQGGYVCRGAGFQIGSAQQTFTPAPVPPRIAAPMPYTYAFVTRKSAPQFLRIPTVEEEAAVAALFAELDARDAARADAGVADGGVADGGVADGGVATLEGEPPSDDAVVTNVIDGGVPETPDDGLPDFVRMRMLRGFYVSVDGEETDPETNRTFTRTVRGAYVRDAATTPNDPPTREGLRLTALSTLPVAFVYRTEIRHQVREGTALRDGGPIAQHTGFTVAGTEGSGNAALVVSSEGFLVRASAVRVARLRARPPRVPEGAKWIHVDLSEQTLVAYEGDTPVYTTTVSSGRAGFATPTGTYRIRTKHVSSTMDDLAAGDEAYSIEDVPWTMFYEGGYALHTAFWHNQFGRVRSHGCVNLAPKDARFLFFWSTPTVPEGVHGATATEANAGTYVFIER